MKKMLLALALFLCISYASNAQTTYCWIGIVGATGTNSTTATSNWNLGSNWALFDATGGTFDVSTNRTTPLSTDILYIDGNVLQTRNASKTTYINNLTKDACGSLIIRNAANAYFISQIGSELISSAVTFGTTVGSVALPVNTVTAGEFSNLRVGDYLSTANTTANVGQVLSTTDGQNMTISNDYAMTAGALYRIPTLTINTIFSIDAGSTLHLGNTTGTAATLLLFSIYLPATATGNIYGTLNFERNASQSRLVAVSPAVVTFQSGSYCNIFSNPAAINASLNDGPFFGTCLGTGLAGSTPNFSFNTNAASIVFASGSFYNVGAGNVRHRSPFGNASTSTSPLVFSGISSFQANSNYVVANNYITGTAYFYVGTLANYGNVTFNYSFPVPFTANRVDNLAIGSIVTAATNTGTVSVYGNITTASPNAINVGNITFAGSSAQIINGTGAGALSFANCTINNAAGISLATTATTTTVNGIITLSNGFLSTGLNTFALGAAASAIFAPNTYLNVDASGTANFNSRSVTLQSTAAGTARINQVNGTLSNATNVTTQVYIPGGRRTNRFLGHPFSTALSMSSLIDNIFVTGSGAGFDATTSNNPSAFWFNNATQAWTGFTSTTDASWTQFAGIRTLIRGDRTQSTSLTGGNPTPNAVTLDMSGSLNVGIQNIALPVGYSVIGNPYPSPVNIGARLNATANIGTTYYVWNANGGVSAGSYTTKTIGATAYNLAMNGAFVVNPASATTINFVEADKQTAATSNLFRNTTKSGLLELQVLYNDYPADNMFIRFNKLSKVSKDDLDGDKLTNPEVNFYAISADNKKLSLDTRPFTDLSVIPLGLTATKANSFKIKVADKGLDEEVYLNDKFMNTVTKLEDGTEYAFDITPAAASQGENRFELMLKKAPVMALIAPSFTVKLSPNPASDMLKVSFTNAEELSTTISITDVEGKLVKTVDAGNVQSGQINVSVKSLAKGSYYITLNNGKENKTEKFQVQ